MASHIAVLIYHFHAINTWRESPSLRHRLNPFRKCLTRRPKAHAQLRVEFDTLLRKLRTRSPTTVVEQDAVVTRPHISQPLLAFLTSPTEGPDTHPLLNES